MAFFMPERALRSGYTAVLLHQSELLARVDLGIQCQNHRKHMLCARQPLCFFEGLTFAVSHALYCSVLHDKYQSMCGAPLLPQRPKLHPTNKNALRQQPARRSQNSRSHGFQR